MRSEAMPFQERRGYWHYTDHVTAITERSTLEPALKDVTFAAFDYRDPNCFLEPANCNLVAPDGRTAPAGLSALARKIARVLPLYTLQCSHGEGNVHVGQAPGKRTERLR